MNILITGNTGFLGSHLQKYLNKENIFTINSQNHNLLQPLKIRLPKLDIIYHCAVFLKAGLFPLTHQADLWEKNQLINTNIMSYWLHQQPQAKFITFGTSCSYSPNTLMIEENYLDGSIDHDIFGFATSKRNIVYGLQCFKHQYGLHYTVFIPSTLCGPEFSENDSHY